MLVTLPFRGIFRLEDTWTESANAEGVASNDRLSGQLDRTAGKGFQLFKQSRHLSHDSMESCGGRELRFHFSTLAGRLRVWGIEGGVVEGVRSGPHLFFFLTPFSSVSSWFGPLTAHLRHAKNILHFDFCPGWATRKRPKSPYLGLYSCQPIARYQVTLNHRCPPQIATLHFLHLVFSKLASFHAISIWGSEGVSLRDEGGVLGAARCSRAGWPLSTRGQQRPSGKTTKKRLQALPNIPWGAKPPPTENH